jgi:hypothetical protein
MPKVIEQNFHTMMALKVAKQNYFDIPYLSRKFQELQNNILRLLQIVKGATSLNLAKCPILNL